MEHKILIPEWVSCRTYNFQRDDGRTFISNERDHEYVLLEDISSDLWHVIETSNDFIELENWCIRHNVRDSLDDFLAELLNKHIICYKNEGAAAVHDYACLPVQTNYEEENTLEIVNEMKNWCYAHGYLYSLFIELTYNCNLRCIHCYNPKHTVDKPMPFEQYKKIIDEAVALGCFHLILSGGESALHSEFIEIVKYARHKRLSIEVFSNGQILCDDPVLLDKLISLYVYRIGLSLYSMNSEIHDAITNVRGSWEKTIGVIKNLRDRNIGVEIKCLQLDCNNTGYMEVVEFARANHISLGIDLSLIPTMNGDKGPLMLELRDESKLVNMYIDKNSPLFIGNLKNYGKKDLQEVLKDGPCYAGISVLSISPALDVTPCCSLPIKLGNLSETNLIDLWKNALEKDRNSILFHWQAIEISDFKECFKEGYCSFCNFCPGMGMLEYGYLKKSDVLCRQAKARQKAYDILVVNDGSISQI
jgi:MoaA/NifB/PqqE/SkfB family radical SAM enzyme